MKFKHFFVICFCLTSCLFCKGQGQLLTTLRMTDSCNHWYVYQLKDSTGGSMWDDYPEDTLHYYIGGDTTFAGQPWKKLMREDSGYVGGIRIDSENIYFIYKIVFYHKDSTHSNLLYNFLCCHGGWLNIDSTYNVDKGSLFYALNSNNEAGMDPWYSWDPQPAITGGAGIFNSHVLECVFDAQLGTAPSHLWSVGVGCLPSSVINYTPYLSRTRAYSGPLIPLYDSTFWGGYRPYHIRQRLWKFVYCGTDSLMFNVNGELVPTGPIQSTDDPTEKGKLRFSPAPAFERACATLPEPLRSPAQLLLYNNQGALLRSLEIPAGETRLCIERGNLPAGTYFCRMIKEGATFASGKISFAP